MHLHVEPAKYPWFPKQHTASAKYHDIFGRPVNIKFPYHERSQCCGSGKYPFGYAKFDYMDTASSSPDMYDYVDSPTTTTTINKYLYPRPGNVYDP